MRLNDAALHFEPESSAALGFGFRCGFLGMLHMEIVQERLEREYDLELITTAPTVIFEIVDTSGNVTMVDNPSRLPPPNEIAELREPIITANILVPDAYVGNVIKLCVEKRGVQKHIRYLGSQVSIEYEMPLAEVVLDFFDRLKSVSRGFASFDYHFQRFEAGAAGAARRADQQGARRRTVDHRASGQGDVSRPRAGREDAGTYTAADVRCSNTGCRRQPDHRAQHT